ncbi:MAG: TonB-dependent receptor plug domain-containing protein [Gemmatimonadetes bacterium]|nr:TonB-dependent receptor plug domain-containing protein [Gemmatimonadota bacterium]
MRQRREDARNIALIVGSGCLGALVVGLGWAAATSANVQDSPEFAVEQVERTLVIAGPKLETRRVAIQLVREPSGELSKQLDEAVLEQLDVPIILEADRIVTRDLHLTGVASASGDGPRVRITGSMATAEGSPIVYVDGVRLDGGLEELEPEDIESVEVVKGDKATEMYGSEARNGVIIVITKSGKKRKGGGRR